MSTAPGWKALVQRFLATYSTAEKSKYGKDYRLCLQIQHVGMQHTHLFVYCLGLLLQSDGGVVVVTKTFWFAKIKICTVWPFTPRKIVPAQCKAAIKIWTAFLSRSKFNLTKSLVTPICSAARGSWNQGDLTGIWLGSDRDLMGSSMCDWTILALLTASVTALFPFVLSSAFLHIFLSN